MSVSFLSPAGALVGIVALVPLIAALARERRLDPVRRLLRLEPPGRRLERSFVAPLVALFALAALAAAQPVLRAEATVAKRTDAEVFFLFDTSRSMLASAAPGSPSRFERALRLGRGIRSGLAGVPVGVASLTDRTLPHLFPTVDAEAFGTVLDRAVGVDRPPPAKGNARATTLAAISALARENYFSPRSAKRLVVAFTDGESRPFDARGLAGKLERNGIGLLVLRIWDAGERVYGRDGRPEPGYVPDTSSAAQLDQLAAATAGGRVFSERELAPARGAARAYLGKGPLVETVQQRRFLPLAGYLLLAAGVPLAFLLVRRPATRAGSSRVDQGSTQLGPR